MQVRAYRSFDELPAGLAPRLSHSAPGGFLLSLDWFRMLFETSLAGSLSPRIYVAIDPEGLPAGALFCGVTGHERSRRLASMTNFYSLEYGCSPAAPARDGSPLAAIVATIADERPRWHSVRLDRLRENAPDTACAIERLERGGYGVRTHFQYENWYVATADETFDRYFAARPSQVRHTITRKRKKLEKTARMEIRVLRGESPDLEHVLRDWITIYEGSWKRPEPFPEFIPGLVRVSARLGVLRLAVLYVDDEPAAGQLWITSAGRTIIYKLAYDERFRDRGVGSILSHEMFRIAIDEDRVREIDYGVGSEPYKKDWMTTVRRLVGVEAYSRRTLPGLAALGVGSLARLGRRVRTRLANRAGQ